MSVTLSFGYKKNQTGDKGSTFFPDLEFNIQRVNDHTHDGLDSAKIPSGSIETSTSTILAAAWAAVVGQTGTYSQDVTVPAGVHLDKHLPRFQNTSTKEILDLCVTILTSTTYRVEINDNTVELQVAYV